MTRLLCLLFIFASLLSAQERPLPQVLPAPSSPVVTDSLAAALPKFDLPEFVITGTASIDLKVPPKEGRTPIIREVAVPPASPGKREPEPERLPHRNPIPASTVVTAPSLRGHAAIGSFRFGELSLSGGHRLGDADIFGSGFYAYRGGFKAYTNEQRAGAYVRFNSRVADSSGASAIDIGGALNASHDRYFFHGSAVPYVRRTIGSYEASARMSTDLGVVSIGAPAAQSEVASASAILSHLTFGVTNVEDSVFVTRENRLNFGASLPLLLFGYRTGASASMYVASHSLWLFHAGVDADAVAFSRLALRGGISMYLGGDRVVSSLVKVYPQVRFDYTLSNGHTLFTQYKPELRPSSLASVLREYPYLSASTPLRHEDISMSISGGIESFWGDESRTRAYVRYERNSSGFLYSDNTQDEIGTFSYKGANSTYAFVTEGFANLTQNDYFSAIFTVQYAENNATRLKVPYVPLVSATVGWLRKITEQFRMEAVVNVRSRVNADALGSSTVPPFAIVGVNSEYRFTDVITAFARVENLLNSHYAEWRRYEMPPFTIIGGVRATL